MNITINGENRQIENELTVIDLLNIFNLKPDYTAVEINGIILKKEQYSDEHVKENDTLELIRFMEGG
ncbi:MAG: sulfur carrier protein ThiS [Candidatus Margulisiibacteriota bacterium]